MSRQGQLAAGTRVLADFEQSGELFPGTIVERLPPKRKGEAAQYSIVYDDGDHGNSYTQEITVVPQRLQRVPPPPQDTPQFNVRHNDWVLCLGFRFR